LDPVRAELRWRGVAASRRHEDSRPPDPDYDDVSPIGPFGRLTEPTTPAGDVLRQLTPGSEHEALVVFANGDEIALDFDAATIPPPRPGFQRTWFLVSEGFARDGDPNTEPLPWSETPQHH